jgi:hypothetical protein
MHTATGEHMSEYYDEMAGDDWFYDIKENT